MCCRSASVPTAAFLAARRADVGFVSLAAAIGERLDHADSVGGFAVARDQVRELDQMEDAYDFEQAQPRAEDQVRRARIASVLQVE